MLADPLVRYSLMILPYADGSWVCKCGTICPRSYEMCHGCLNIGHKVPKVKECRQCQAIVNGTRYYCSHECRQAAADARFRAKVRFRCRLCGDPMEKPHREFSKGTHHYCSQECYGDRLLSRLRYDNDDKDA